jgi:putative membrane protein
MKKIPLSHLLLLAGVAVVLAWSAWQPYDRLTWWLEVLPALVALVVLFATYRRFEFTTLTYILIALHMCVLFVGGHYTYARVPLFDWLRPVFGWHRNHYDRLGHIMQGFVPAIITREVFIRLQVLKRTRWQPFLIVCVCLAISAFYELIEWWTALASGDAAISFLGTQGDLWDTQEDMFCAFLSAIAALALLSRLQDHAISRLPGRASR